MREIKFRVYSIDKKRYFPLNFIGYHNNTLSHVNVDEGDFKTFTYMGMVEKLCVLEQFTGLKDKKGKEIYEGDIGIAQLHRNGNRIETFRGVIEYHTGHSACFVLNIGDGYKPIVSFLFNASFEVIGNIHDNPELLKGE